MAGAVRTGVDRISALAYRSIFDFYGFFIVIVIAALETLLPDDDAVSCLGVSGPLAVDGDGVRHRLRKIKQCTRDRTVIRARSVLGIPPFEGVAGAGGILGHGGRRARLIVYERRKHRNGEGRVGQVCVEDQPVAGVDGCPQGDVPGKGVNRFAVLVDHGLTLYLRQELLPAAELAGRAGRGVVCRLRYIRKIHFVRMRFRGAIREQDLVVLDDDAFLVQIRNDVGFEDHGVVVNFVIAGSLNDRVFRIGQYLGNVITDALNGHALGLGRIIRILRPALEETVRRRVCAGIVNILLDLVQLALVDLLHDRVRFTVSVEVDRQTHILFGTGDDVDREGAGLEVRAVRRRAAHQAHAARCAFVPDAEAVAQQLTAGVDGNADLVLVLRLDLVAVRIIERDVDRNRVDRLAADCLLRKFERFCVADAGQHHLRAGGEDACRSGRVHAHAVRSGTVEGLRRHFGLRHFVARILRLDAHDALDQRGRIHGRTVIGIPADERTTFDRGRFGQLADRRSRQN